jgi:hypothetical protein
MGSRASHPTPPTPAGSAPQPNQPETQTQNQTPSASDIAAAFEAVHRQLLLDDVPIHRGPAVDAEARSLAAHAFTRDANVFLTADRDGTQATLEHELVHVAQQRVLRDRLPLEHTPAGHALEQAAGGTDRSTDPVPHGVQRQPAVEPQEEQAPEPEPAEPDHELRDQVAALARRRSLDLDDAAHIAELATKIYEPLRGLLRAELVVDRERAGLLTDFRYGQPCRFPPP